MAMGLRIKDCAATPSSITIFFSDAVNDEVTNPTNYTVEQLGIGEVTLSDANASVTYHQVRHAAVITEKKSSSNPWNLQTGHWIAVTVNDDNVKSASGAEFEDGGNAFATQVNGDSEEAKKIGRATRAVEDTFAFPVLTEEVGFAPSPRPSGAPSAMPGGAPLGQTATKAISDVLGWQLKEDPKAFVGALNASFALTTVGGHTEATWTPRSYAVQTDLSGGITGAQASIYQRAKEALDQSLPLLDGLYPLFKEAADEDVAAVRAMVRSQFTDLVNELGLLGGPRISRVSQLFLLLLGGKKFPVKRPFPADFVLETDPDEIGGSLGNLRVEFGLSIKADVVNTVEDEQNVTNFRIVSDYVTSLAQSWLNNLQFFGLTTVTPFFGTQLVLLSRQLSVVAESVNEVRFTLDSVFIGPAERQTLQIRFSPSDDPPPMFLEDLLTWIDSFAAEEGPRLIQDGGKFAVGESFGPIATELQKLIRLAEHPANARQLPRGYRTARVQRSLEELADQLQQLVDLAAPIKHVITPEPEPETALAVLAVNPASIPASDLRLPASAQPNVTLIGTGFKKDATVAFAPAVSGPGPVVVHVDFVSKNMLLVTLATGIARPVPGLYDVAVTNPDGESATLGGGFTIKNGSGTAGPSARVARPRRST
jgi:hypothetical protein